MFSYKSAVKDVLRKNPVEKSEKVIHRFGDSEADKQGLSEWDEVQQLTLDYLDALRKTEKLSNVLKAKRTLFWENLSEICERAESAEARGCSLGVRWENDQMVLVEFAEETPQDVIPPQIRKMMENGSLGVIFGNPNDDNDDED